jgi:5-methylcytosine-specific restriction endonuclease McrA
VDLISRANAKIAGLVHYFTGTPCCRGHVEPRNTKNGKCMGCDRVHHKSDYDIDRSAYIERNAKSYIRNKAQISAARLARRDLDREATRAKWRADYHAKKKQIRKKRAASYAANPHKIREANIAYAKENPEVGSVRRRNRRARKVGNGGRHSKAEIAALAVAQKWMCACGCGVSIRTKFHADHIIPLSRGGSNWIDNIQLLTPRCNLTKHTKDPVEWAASLEHNKRGEYLCAA